MKPILKKIFTILVYLFAVIGFVLVAGYFAVRFGWTNTKGVIDTQTEEFRKLGATGTIEAGPWDEGEEWQNFKAAIVKDKNVLAQTEAKTGVPARLIVGVVAVEQLRLYYSERQTFKEVFAPLKILGTQSQFSWGIAGIKEATAIDIENHAKNPNSLYFPGKGFETALAFKTDDIANERFLRMTDYKDRSYQYLYTALYIRELASGWKKSGFDISKRPEILSTLFNIGFAHSNPNAEPKAGGAEITINDRTYSFGGLAGEVYYSSELTDIYPKKEMKL